MLHHLRREVLKMKQKSSSSKNANQILKNQFRHYEKAKKQKLTAPINLLVSRKIRSSDHWGLSDPICKATRLCSLAINMREVLVDRESDNNDNNDQTSTTRYARLRVQAVHSHERPQLWNSEGSVFGFWSGFSWLLCRFVWFFAIIIYFQNIDFNQNDCLPASLLCSLVTKGRQQRFPWGGHGWCDLVDVTWWLDIVDVW